jgi:hypothetical protein
MPKLDGTEKIGATPYDAHEQVVRGNHAHSPAEGYQAKEYEHQEYPKAIAHDKETGDPIVVKDADEEAAAKSKKKGKV